MKLDEKSSFNNIIEFKLLFSMIGKTFKICQKKEDKNKKAMKKNDFLLFNVGLNFRTKSILIFPNHQKTLPSDFYLSYPNKKNYYLSNLNLPYLNKKLTIEFLSVLS